MKVIVPTNNKGGVGKTSIATIIADYCSRILHKKTLVIDLDSQCNFSQRLLRMEVDPSFPDGHIPPIHPDYEDGEDWDGRSSIADIFLNPEKGIVPYPTLNEYLDIAPAHAANLKAVELVRRDDVLPLVHNRFRDFLALPDVREAYDVVVIDTAPSKGPLTISAIRAATDVIIPAIMEDKSIRGVYGMLQLWMQESLQREEDNKLNLVGILPNMFDARTSLHNDLYHSLLENSEIAQYVMPHKLARRINFAENDCDNASPKSIFDLSKSNQARQEALKVCEYIAGSVFNG